MHEIKVDITGNVQMVMFRDFIQRHASTLGLSGTTKNLENGSVEVIAQGKKDVLETFIELLRKGPFLAQVVRVDVQWLKPTEDFKGFTITY